MKLYVARHGQSEANRIGIIAGGEDDSPLTDQGWIDAANLARKMRGFHGLIVSSPLHRAMQTAEYVRDQILPGAPIRIDADFAERDMGSATGKPRDEYYRMERSNIPIAGAETPDALFERVRKGLEIIQASRQDTLLVAHDATYRMIVCALQHLPAQEFSSLPNPANGAVAEFDL